MTRVPVVMALQPPMALHRESTHLNVSGRLLGALQASTLTCTFNRSHGQSGAPLSHPEATFGYLLPSAWIPCFRSVPARLLSSGSLACTVPNDLPVGRYLVRILKHGTEPVPAVDAALLSQATLKFTVFPSDYRPRLPVGVPITQLLHLGATLTDVCTASNALNGSLRPKTVPLVGANSNGVNCTSSIWTPLVSADGSWQVRHNCIHPSAFFILLFLLVSCAGGLPRGGGSPILLLICIPQPLQSSE
jgi:hypothetical protein